MERKSFRKRLLEIMEKLSTEEKEIIIMRFWFDWEGVYTLKEIEEKFWIMKKEVNQIEERILRKLRKSKELRELVR
jgi:RNA polymerase sigma factor (sigma-70 family)